MALSINETPNRGNLSVTPQSVSFLEPFLKDHADVAAEILLAMGNAKRLLILCHLVEGEVAVGQLAPRVGLSQSALSQHLAKLRSSGLVDTRREAQTIYYSSSSMSVLEIFAALKRVFHTMPADRLAVD